MISDQKQDIEDRRVAVFVLGVLAQEGHKDAELALLGPAGSADHPLVDEALVALLESDREGNHRDIYQFQAKQGRQAAINALAVWWDAASKKVYEEILERGSDETSPLREFVPQVRGLLAHLELLQSSEWQSEVERILEVPTELANQRWVKWALQVSSLNGMSVLPVLQKRLEESELRMSNTYDRLSKPGDPSFKTSFRTDFMMSESEAPYDDLLVAYAARGGKLNELETMRLTGLGYLGDPATNLARLISERE